MRRLQAAAAVALAILLTIAQAAPATAQGRGRGVGRSRAARSFSQQIRNLPQQAVRNHRLLRHHRLQPQLSKAQQRLDQRLAVSEQLREIARRNGNESLLDTADRMDHKAVEHYEKQLAQFQQPEQGDVEAAGNSPLARQISRQSRQLNQQLDTAQRLRELAAASGDPELLKAADQLELRALDRFQSQVENLAQTAADLAP